MSRGWGSSVDIATELRAGRSSVRIPTRTRNLYLLQNSPGQHRLVFSGYRRLSSPGVKGPGREIDHPPPSSIKGTFTSTPPHTPSWRGQGPSTLFALVHDKVKVKFTLKQATNAQRESIYIALLSLT